MTTCGCTWQRRVWGWLQYSPSQFDLEPSQGGREYKNISMNIRISIHITFPGLDFQVQKLTAKMAHSHKMTLAFGSAPSMFVPSKRFACCYRLPSMKSFLKLHKFKYVWLSLIHLAADPATQKAPYSGSLNALNIAGKTPETPGTCCSCLLRGGGSWNLPSTFNLTVPRAGYGSMVSDLLAPFGINQPHKETVIPPVWQGARAPSFHWPRMHFDFYQRPNLTKVPEAQKTW